MKWDFAILIAGFLLGAWLQSEYSFTTQGESDMYFEYCQKSFLPSIYFVLKSRFSLSKVLRTGMSH